MADGYFSFGGGAGQAPLASSPSASPGVFFANGAGARFGAVHGQSPLGLGLGHAHAQGYSHPQGYPHPQTQVVAASIHHQTQLDLAAVSRQTAAPHHHARIAAAQARTNANLASTSSTTTASSSTTMMSSVANTSTSASISINVSVKLQQNQTDPAKPSQWAVIDLGGMAVKNLSRDIFRYTFLTTLYINHNHLTTLSPDISRLVNLKTLDISGNKLSSLPPELGIIVSLKNLLVFDNNLASLPFELGFLFQLDVLGLEGNPLAEPIYSLMQKEGTPAVITYLRDNCPMTAQPLERDWVAFDEDVAANSSDVFTVFCYNILCERYASPQMYAYTPSWALNWEYRKELFMQQEILSYDADIVCLQEVEMNQFDDFFKVQMALAKYDGVFFPKSRARTMDDVGRKQVDGCATFFKTSKYKLLEHQSIEFQQIAMQRPEFRKTEDIFNRVMIKDNIAVLTLLENIDTKQKLLVANAHLHWDPSYRDVKLLQTAMLLDEIERFLPKNSRIPVLVCGDFNSKPDSGVYHFIQNGSVPADHEDMTPPPGSPTSAQHSSLAAIYPNGLQHRLHLNSAYGIVNELDFTNWTPTFRDVIDYVWYDTKHLKVVGLLGNVDKDYCAKHVGFPNWHHPSDHIPLLVQLRIIDDPSTRKKINQGLMLDREKMNGVQGVMSGIPALGVGGGGGGLANNRFRS